MGINFKKKTWILDGAMGTELQKMGLEVGEIPEILVLDKPEIIEKIHKSYIDAGSEIIYTNTFGANRYKLEGSGYTVAQIVEKAVQIGKNAVGNKGFVGLDIGPIGQMLEPNGTLSFEDAYDVFKEIIVAGKDADLIIFETMTDLYEVKAGVLAAKENSDLPILVSMTFEENGRTFLGCSLSEMVEVLEGLEVDGIGLNCSLGPLEIAPLAKQLVKLTNLPIILKPNAGLPNPKTGEYNFSPIEFAKIIDGLYSDGISIVGGCCGTSPEFIKEICKTFKNKAFVKRDIEKNCKITSGTKSVELNTFRVIGERINPTGKKLLKEAILNNNLDYIVKLAIEQVENGADILDINIGLPKIDEAKLMSDVIKKIQSIIDIPLQIDSTSPQVIEAGLRAYNGKAIINSVNAEEESLSTILPLAKKYGAAVIGLCLDEKGIPLLAEERFEVAKKIHDRALEYGIKKENIIIDCLALTASAQQKEVFEGLKALRLIKERLGLKTVLGVSNISFGMPRRELINKTFLALALYEGLSLGILDPNSVEMMDTIKAYKVLSYEDVSSKDFIEYVNKNTLKADDKIVEAKNKDDISIEESILKGLKAESEKAAKELLKTKDEMDVINNYLIKALDIVGEKFEKGELFLPQLLQAAQAAQGAFDVVKEKLILSGNTSISDKKIILATVKGDVHDIGKNIVKVILENYGYNIIDLGKDVAIEKIVEVAKEHNVKMVGLSALMTTTLKNMELTIKSLRENNIDCKIVVGGAVLTEEYAKEIGADFYAKDAKSGVDIAKLIFGD